MPLIGNTQLSSTKQDLIAALVQRELISAAVVKPSIRDVSQFAVKGAKTIAFPRAGSFTVEDRATTAQASLVTVTYATDQLTVDRMATVSWIVDPQDELESAINVEADLVARAARALGKDFDTQVIAGLESSASATTTAGAISKSIFLEMRQLLLAQNADPNSLYFLCGPDSEAVLLGITEFVDANTYGSARIPSGVLGMLYGVKVIMSTQIAANTFYMYDSEGYCYGFQKDVSMGERPAPEYGVGALLRTMDAKWGHKALQNSVLLKKDNN